MAESDADEARAKTVEYLIRHIVLPAQLPHTDDWKVEKDDGLLEMVSYTLADLKTFVVADRVASIDVAMKLIDNLVQSRDAMGNATESQIQGLLEELTDSSATNFIPLEIKAQNAAMLISRDGEDLLFECFELSPTNEAAMTKGRLIRHFPALSARVPVSRTKDNGLIKTLASTMAKMTTQEALGARPEVQKAKSSHSEPREPVNPALVADWFMKFIAAVGTANDTTRITKYTREEVLWQEKQPWRRSPLWLLMRVSLQLCFTRQEVETQSESALYKIFMIHLLSHLQQKAKNHWAHFGNDPIQLITAKVQRRLTKLEASGMTHGFPSDWLCAIQERVAMAHDFTVKKWKSMESRTDKSLIDTAIRSLQPDVSLDIKLPELDTFIADIKARTHVNRPKEFKPPWSIPAFAGRYLPDITAALSDAVEHKCFVLAAFEQWVNDHQHSWINSHRKDIDTCGRLHELMKEYHKAANTVYAGIPTSMSIMYLTLIELWIMADKAACHLHPELEDYNTEVLLDQFETLSLPLRTHMKRLLDAETYIQSRQDKAQETYPSIYRQFGHRLSFAVRYFDQSPEMQALKTKIEDDARRQRQKKWEELARLQREYQDLIRRYDSGVCAYRKVMKRCAVTGQLSETTVHQEYCSRCKLKTDAEALSIEIHEWPLSPNAEKAKATVFELNPPKAFSDWRDSSVYLITDILRFTFENPQRPHHQYCLTSHTDLSGLLSKGQYDSRRIVPWSQIKGHTETYYRKKLPVANVQDDSVCPENARVYRYYDSAPTQRYWCTKWKPNEELPQNLFHTLPKRASALNRFMHRPPSASEGLPSNESIASVNDCPDHFCLEEYRVFTTMPLGRNVIYQNIVAQLAMPSIDFAKPETQTLIAQIIHEAGPSNDCVERKTHRILTEQSFANIMLEQLERSHEKQSLNWDSWRAAAILSQLARRVLSCSKSNAITERSLDFLYALRQTSVSWQERIQQRIADTTSSERRTELYTKLVEVTFLCSSTFDVEDEVVEDVLQQADAVSTFLRNSIIISENRNSTTSTFPGLHKAILQDWRLLSHRIFPHVHAYVLRSREDLDRAVLASWAAFNPASRNNWKIVDKTRKGWLSTTSGSLPVHINLITGELLIDGAPLARLPEEYTQHATYARLFPNTAIDVGPSDEPGMRFSAKAIHRGYKLHFGTNRDDILVVATMDETQLNLVPSGSIMKHLPTAFARHYIHWYDRQSNEVVFRCARKPWISRDDEWRLHQENGSWRMRKGTNLLLNPLSHSTRVISKVFFALEDKSHIHITRDDVSHTIDIALPRLHLDFIIPRGANQIQSRQYRDWTVDQDQELGTLIGLTSKLVLKNERHERQVLIPVPGACLHANAITYRKDSDNHHVTVSVDRKRASKAYSYRLDRITRRIVDNGELQAKLLLGYLHALTSGSIPDTFTGYTGTESALILLRSGGVQSFETLSTENVAIMTLLAKLSPVRKFYPPFESTMQQVTWDEELPAHCQRPEYAGAVQAMFKHAQTQQMLHPGHKFKNPMEKKEWKSSNTFLDERESIRSANYQVCDFGAENYSTCHDTIYETRDRPIDSERGQRAFAAATFISRDCSALLAQVPDFKKESKSELFGRKTVKCTNPDFQSTSLQYDAKWLQDLSTLMAENFCSAHRCLSDPASKVSRYDITAWLSTMAYATSANMTVVQALGMMYKSRRKYTMMVPPFPEIHPAWGEIWSAEQLKKCIKIAVKNIADCPENDMEYVPRERRTTYARRQREEWLDNQLKPISDFVADLSVQKFKKNLRTPRSKSIDTYIDTSLAMTHVQLRRDAWEANRVFFAYLAKLSGILAAEKVSAIPTKRFTCVLPPAREVQSNLRHYVNAAAIFAAGPPEAPSDSGDLFVPEEDCRHFTKPVEPHINVQEKSSTAAIRSNATMNSFQKSLRHFAKSRAVYENDYVKSLKASCNALKELGTHTSVCAAELDATTEAKLHQYLQDCKDGLSYLENAMLRAARGEDGTIRNLAFRVQHAPRISPTFWLTHLNREKFHDLSVPWKNAIVEYALAVTRLHRAQRLVMLSKKPIELAEELSHIGHANWDPIEFPETLLFEVESGIMLREVQETIASHMRTPPAGNNAVLQLNMGQGKSSTMVPTVAAFLASGNKLVRVIAGKPQKKQMHQMLVSKLGGLLGRRIYQTPFSRDHRPSAADAAAIKKIWQDCMSNRGILLVQPEDILSYKLMGIECLLTNRHETAKVLLDGQAFLDQCSRDIIDETDEQFSVKSELIYTMGCQTVIEFAPERWVVLQSVLAKLPSLAWVVKSHLPKAIEVQDSAGRFPMIRILDHDAEVELLDLLAKNIVNSGLIAPVSSLAMKEALLRYITVPDVAAEDIAMIEGGSFWVDSIKETTLLVRGLMASGSLASVLRTKRWRVNYGLDNTRSPPTDLAVPYRFKDGPALRSDYSHPDVRILLTLLSYYYGGLTDMQLFDTFNHLLASGQANVHFNAWIATASPNLPEAFKQLSGIAIQDRVSCVDEVFPHLRYSKNCIDYFLAHLVFPKQLREFESKLSASGWDLGATKIHPTVGFSGTNDTRPLLPLSMDQIDLPSQTHTNAMVLSLLIQDRKTSVECLPPRTDETDAEHLLTAVVNMESEVRVIIDCGATILEQNNKQIVEAWLRMTDCNQIEAAVFFDDEELSVLDRTGRVESFRISPFAQQLDRCIVYLDESHSRGIDLKLPRHYRAGVTLGSGLTKDKLVQGCMRMRQLGSGQSVAFILPEEISTKIRKRTRVDEDDDIEVEEVLLWCIGETWTDLRKSIAPWAVQGHRYESSKQALNGRDTTEEQAKLVLEPDAQNLEDRYRPAVQDIDGKKRVDGWDKSQPDIARIIKQCEDYGVMGHFDEDDLEEEQEREIAPEREEQRQAELPQKMKAADHELHPDLKELAQTGMIVPAHTAFKPAFQSLGSTSAAKLIDLSEMPCDLLVTADFARTIVRLAVSKDETYVTDSFLRPVQHVLSVMNAAKPDMVQNLILISPHEANLLKSYVRGARKITMHTFKARIHECYPALDKLDLYNMGRDFNPDTLSASLKAQLNLFSGSLYLDSYEEYTGLCDFLGLAYSDIDLREDQQVFADGFISPPQGAWALQTSAVPFLRALLMRIRHKGDGLEKTHLGKMLNGVRLEEADFTRDVDMSENGEAGPEEIGDPMDLDQDHAYDYGEV